MSLDAHDGGKLKHILKKIQQKIKTKFCNLKPLFKLLKANEKLNLFRPQ